MRALKGAGLSLVALVLLLAGCQRLNEDRTVDLEPQSIKYVSVDPPRSQQQVTVLVSSPGVPVDVHLVAEGEKDAAMKSLELGKRLESSKLLTAAQLNVESATLEATVPARTGFTVLLSGARKKAAVHLKITGR
jgi:hypothetical protein